MKLGFDLTIHAHFLIQSANPCLNDGFVLAGVAAARIAPQSRAVVFIQSPSLKQPATIAIENENGKRPM